ncbi:MAG: TGS domain-containing protein, partial [Acidobacteriota bacterium]|nr:TGS domain-containing protein [Acidobacteriota bacterium]
MKVDLFADEVYTFTPRGNVLSFSAGATPIDFAYTIHTEIGHTTVGAKVNGRIVPLKYELQNGDIVEILTQPNKQPNRDWLSVAKTSRARSKIRAWINANEREESIRLGSELTEKEFRKYKVSPKKLLQGVDFDAALKKLGVVDMDDYHAAVGYGRLTAHALIQQLVPDAVLAEKPEGVVRRVVQKALGTGDRGVQVRGLDDMMIHLAHCCNPVRGEKIVGYITRGKGVSVHSLTCPNVKSLMYDSER